MLNKPITIIGDSRSMKEIKDESVHLVITSPPYWQFALVTEAKKEHFVDCEREQIKLIAA